MPLPSSTSVGDGRTVVPTADTAVALEESYRDRDAIVITAEADNTGVIVVSGSTVNAGLAARRGTPLNAGESISLDVDSPTLVHIDATASGDGVTYTSTA